MDSNVSDLRVSTQNRWHKQVGYEENKRESQPGTGKKKKTSAFVRIAEKGGRGQSS